MNKKILTSRKLTTAAVLGAITIVLGITPLGLIPLGIINATTMHIPVIIAAIVEGPVVGGLVGLIFGVFSLINAILRPTPISFVFYNPLISVIPRILIGITSYYAYQSVKRFDDKNLKIASKILWSLILIFLSYILYKNIKTGASKVNIILIIILILLCLGLFYYSIKTSTKDFPIAIGAFVGSMTNTILVLGGIYLMYAQKYVEALNIPLENARSAILGVSISSGLPEAFLSIIIVTGVVKSVLKVKR
ncbi:ECF transporter S component [Anaerococcus sp. Marseille-Q5996]|uniref:ECF transporter S component n=1 Tax=Anaerococcus sp. Marseille-Q5996 TaxID=2972769 RepID=UPI0021C69D36|nr:ECF transporter S component [Anaerococcus sp. Marseille-Q5996]